MKDEIAQPSMDVSRAIVEKIRAIADKWVARGASDAVDPERAMNFVLMVAAANSIITDIEAMDFYPNDSSEYERGVRDVVLNHAQLCEQYEPQQAIDEAGRVGQLMNAASQSGFVRGYEQAKEAATDVCVNYEHRHSSGYLCDSGTRLALQIAALVPPHTAR